MKANANWTWNRHAARPTALCARAKSKAIGLGPQRPGKPDRNIAKLRRFGALNLAGIGRKAVIDFVPDIDVTVAANIRAAIEWCTALDYLFGEKYLVQSSRPSLWRPSATNDINLLYAERMHDSKGKHTTS